MFLATFSKKKKKSHVLDKSKGKQMLGPNIKKIRLLPSIHVVPIPLYLTEQLNRWQICITLKTYVATRNEQKNKRLAAFKLSITKKLKVNKV